MTTSSDISGPGPERRSLGKQLDRRPKVIHASWLTGVAVALTASVGGGFIGGRHSLLVVVSCP